MPSGHAHGVPAAHAVAWYAPQPCTAEELQELVLEKTLAWAGTVLVACHLVRTAQQSGALASVQLAAFSLPIIVAAIVSAWLSPAAYLRRRPIVYALCRLLVFWVPATTSTETFDIVARAPNGVPVLGPVLTVLLCVLASRAWLLVYSAFVCKLPFRAHLVVQTLNFVSLAVGPARSNFCASELLSAPPADAILSKVHAAAAAIGGCLLPASAALSTYSTGASCHATLLFVWTVVGWLVPSVALLPDPPGGQPSCEPWPERSLRLLKLPASSEAHDWVTCASRWLFSLVIVWSLCCLATDAGAVGTS